MFMNVISSVIEFYGTCYKLKYIYPGEERVSGGPMICHRQSFLFFFLLFSLFLLKYMFVLFSFCFHFQPLCFLLLIFIIDPFGKFFMFSIQSLNYNLSYIFFHKFGTYSFDLSFLPLDLLLTFYQYSILSFNQSLCYFFFNLAFILLIFFLFVNYFFLFDLTLQFNF